MRNLTLLFIGLFASVLLKAQPSLSFVVASQTCSEGVGTYNIAVNITNPDANPTSVDINVAGGNAQYGINFTYGPVTLTFPANSSLGLQFTVTVIDDSTVDGDKTAVFALANPTNNATISGISQTALIMRDVDTPVLNIYPTTQFQYQNIGTINVPVSLSRGIRDTTKVNVRLIPSGTTAVKGVDFTFTDTTLVWPPDSAGIINAVIPVIFNPFYEHARTVQVGLQMPVDTIGAIFHDSIFTLTIEANPNFTAAGCSDLFFGQYIQGSGNNQALQIFNPTSVAIDLSVYSIVKSVNGGTLSAYPLTGNIAPNGVYVLANTGAASGISSIANATSSFFHFDGTDALALLHLTDTIDVIGQLHLYPGLAGWTAGTGTTVQRTLIRNFYTHAGDTSWANASSTWNGYPLDMLDSLGFHHTAACGTDAPVATVRFIRAYDTIPQVDSTVYVIVEINNPTPDSTRLTVIADNAVSTAVNGYGFDYVYTNQTFNSPPGISYDTLPVLIFATPELTPVKTIVFKFTRLSTNLGAIPDSVYTIYLYNHNKFVVSFLGAGYSYPKSAGRVKIPLVITTYSSNPTNVDVTLSSGSAVQGVDFVFADTTVTFPAFSLDTQAVWVSILNNNIYEANKQANFNLSNATNDAVLGISAFTLTIVNNDSLAGEVKQTNQEVEFSLYPNPVAGNLFISSAAELEDARITDVFGNVIVSFGNLEGGTSKIEVSLLANGIYFLKATAKGNLICRKFIKIE